MSTRPNGGNTGRRKFLSWAEQITKDLWICLEELDEEWKGINSFRGGDPLPFVGGRDSDNVFSQFGNTIDGGFELFLKLIHFVL